MIRLETLGTAELRDEHGTVLHAVLSQPKRFALLVFLSMASPRGYHRRDTLLGVFWPELDEERARASLSQALYYLRRSVGAGVVVSRGREEVGVDPRHLWSDAVSLEEALDSATPDSLASAIELYRGELLPGFYLSDAPEFERWLEDERSRLRHRVGEAAWQAAEAAAALSEAADALWWSRRAASVSGWQEARLRPIIDRLAQSGNHDAAVRLFDEAAERMRRDLELDPSPELRRWMDELRARAPRGVVEGMRPLEEPGALPDVNVGDPAPAGESLGPASLPEPERLAAEMSVPETPAPRRRSSRLVRFVVVAGAALVILILLAQFVPRADLDRNRVAVLPLADLSANDSAAWIADGLTAELISRMARLRDLRIIPFSTVMRYRDSGLGAGEISRELDAGTVVEGSVHSVGEAMRITVTLVDAESEAPVWSATYDTRRDELLDVQRSIAEDVARALKIERRPEAELRQAERWPGSAAYEEYLRGRALLGEIDPSMLRRALAHFRRAEAYDSTFALALSGLSNVYGQLIANFAMSPDSAPLVRHYAEQALTLDETLAEAHAALALVLSKYYWDSKSARRHFERAIELDPSYADAYRGYASHLRDHAEFERAHEQLRLARDLDRSPMTALEHGILLYLWGKHDEAIAELIPLLARAREAPRARFAIALAQGARGNYDAALASLALADPDGDLPEAIAHRAYLQAKLDRGDEARAVLRQDAVGANVLSAFQQAVVYTALGEHDRALQLLEQSAERRSWLMRLIKVEPAFTPLRTDPRFERLLHRVGLATPMSASGTRGAH